MKKSLSRQFIALLLIPVILILAISYYIISSSYSEQADNARDYCITTLDNVEINISSMVSSMKKTATMFASKQETQSYLIQDTAAQKHFDRQPFFDMIELSKVYTTDLVDIVVWDKHNPISMISYISANMENFIVENFTDDTENTSSYFEFYIDPVSSQPYLIYFTSISMTTFSENFGEHLGNIAIICKTTTLDKLVNSTSNIYLDIIDTTTGQIVYVNNYSKNTNISGNHIFYQKVELVPSTNLSITGAVYSNQINVFSDTRSEILILLALLCMLFTLYTGIIVQRLMIRPIHKLNNDIETIDYEHDNIQLRTSMNNEIGSIASHVNTLLSKISSLNQHNIKAQAKLYEMELSEKQAQLYAYQSQINPHFLYNMLQCMRGISLMHGMTEVAQICTNMAELFRYSIKGTFLVPLEEEIKIIDKYLYMIQIRFQDKISYRLSVDDNVKKCLIPKMILQPLVENAIFHGLESIEENGFLHIRAFREQNELFITIQDNGIGFDADTLTSLNASMEKDIATDFRDTIQESKSLGILNIHNKIRLYEGSSYGIHIHSTFRNTEVILHLNASLSDSSET